jgi:integrase/recombinase XerD
MNRFIQYLEGKKYSSTTTKAHLANIKLFDAWLVKQNITDATVKYNDLLAYIQQQKKKKINAATINLRLNSIQHYYEHLKQQRKVKVNPAKTLRVKGAIKKVIHSPFTFEELEILYRQYVQLTKETHIQEITNLLHQRNIVVLSLMIWQGLHSGELQKLTIEHINLKEGTIYIPATSRSNNRELKLCSQQILPLSNYLQQVRSLLCPKGNELFPGIMYNLVGLLLKELQGINPAVKNAQHIRASVILHWLKLYNKRQVQYMAGHKYVSSTERYAVQDLVALTDELSRHHPFG